MPTQLPTVSIATADKADAVVVGVRRTKDGPELVPGAQDVDKALGGRLLEALKTLGAGGRADEISRIPTLGRADFPLVVAAGVGDEASDEALRRAVGAALRGLGAHARVHIAIDAEPGVLALGALLGSYAFTDYKSQPATRRLKTVTVAGGSSARAEVKRATAVAKAVTAARDLVNTPPNDLYPQVFAERARELASAQGLDVEVLDEKALKRRGFGGILGVGQGSVRPPRLVRITYRPARAKQHLALVGKGITFDTGGVNLKTANLTWMKSDMGGAAAAVAAIAALAELKVKVDVTATVPMAENMPSGSAYRPSDVLHMYGGRTVEIDNTDAEGRLILADAIVRAGEDDPDFLVEASTLTGAQLVSLGSKVIGAMGEPAWRDTVVAAAGRAGESAWAMPLPEDLRPGLDSPVADLVNSPTERWGGMLVAGLFLKEFVPAGLPWVHLDIAGPAWNLGGPHGYTPKGGTGAAVRTMIAVGEELAGR
ncbi:leucyl aminopeptidase family protein [Jatrophihabitans fulvus]